MVKRGLGLQILRPESHKNLYVGILLAVIVAMASMFVSEHYGGPVMLYALLLGIAFNFLNEDPRFQPGIEFSASAILKIGVACLGLRVTFGDIASLGWPTVILVTCGLVLTIIVGWGIGRAFGLKSDHAMLSAGAVAICGASAALAISAILPAHEDRERNTILTVVGVTVLSTIAMVIYPVITGMMGFSDKLAGTFIGATVHDVAQVVGAGYTISDTAGDTSAIVKLMRVTFLAPVVFILVLMFRQRGEDGQGQGALVFVPPFVIVFLLFVIANSSGIVPGGVEQFGSDFSRWCLIIAIAALGCKTSLRALVDVGIRPIIVLTAQTLFLAGFALAGLALFF
ncbi:MAG: putative sulfate exporter family transporter [Pseudomonadota bacterium]